jgi:hypothetical protein
MAVSIDTVYQRVLALANKEQRGYITPQEFNLLANQAQMSIFESYFYIKNQRNRAEPDRFHELDETDIDTLMGSKLNPFRSVEEVIANGGVEDTFPTTVGVDGVQIDVFQTGRVFFGGYVCKKISINEAERFNRSGRHRLAAFNSEAVYTDNPVTGRDIIIYSASDTTGETSGATVECFRVPVPANWAYVVVNDKALYNATLAVNFELHRSEEDTLVTKILELAGIVINKVGLAQTANAMSGVETQTQNT